MNQETRDIEKDIDRIISENGELQIANQIKENNLDTQGIVTPKNKGSISINYLAIAIAVVIIGGIYLGYLLAK